MKQVRKCHFVHVYLNLVCCLDKTVTSNLVSYMLIVLPNLGYKQCQYYKEIHLFELTF